ncbi:MAG: 16S rRNA (guanine(966)-N(2))-methyltransferase RsmD [Clostridia bacterium]|nr:16S rRNA (guanine(966)-N(2))-methyltransferase RsmD [Clostridia bacterium]
MRIIAGSAGGRRLRTLPGTRTRPTADRVKEAIFSMLTAQLPGSRVLDAFAGSGALGLEALSRGADAAWFCENNAAAARICAANIEACAFAAARLITGDLFAVLTRLRREQPLLRFDLIFLDPPYAQGLLERAMTIIARDCWLSPDGLVVAESAAAQESPGYAGFTLIKDKKYGDTAVRFYRPAGAVDQA